MKTKIFLTVLFTLSLSLFYSFSYSQNAKNGRLQTEIELIGLMMRDHSSNKNLMASCRLGYLFNNNLFLGGGVGIGKFKFPQYGEQNEEQYGASNNYIGKYSIFSSAKYSIPLYKNKSLLIGNLSILAGADAGYHFYEEYIESNKKNALFFMPKIGLGTKVGKNKKSSINLYASYTRENNENYLGGIIGFSF